MVAALSPDVVLCDVRLRGSSGLDLCRRLIEPDPDCRVLLLTVYDDEQYLFQALRAGAAGYLLKRVSGEELVRSLEQVHAGETVVDATMAARVASSAARLDSGEFWPGAQLGLSQRESEVLGLIVGGPLQPGHRETAVHRRGDGEEPRAGHLPQARRQRQDRRRGRGAARGSLPVSRAGTGHGLGLPDPERENALLTGIIEAISAGPELGPLAASVARLIVEATGTDVCFVHVLDDGGGALTLTGATPPFDSQVGRIRLAVGEGVSGWVASHREPAVIAAGKEADPRYRYFPELGGQDYTSMVSVPDGEPSDRSGRRAERAHQAAPRLHRPGRPAARPRSAASSPGRCTRPGCTGGWRPGSTPRNGSPSRSSRPRKRNGAGWPATSTTGSRSGWSASPSTSTRPPTRSRGDASRRGARAGARQGADRPDAGRGPRGDRRAAPAGPRRPRAGRRAGQPRPLDRPGARVRVVGTDCRLPEHVEIALYRIAQEALQNVVKHAQATHADVELRCDASRVLLRVTDDGQGFDIGARPDGEASYGLRSMTERAELMAAGSPSRPGPGLGTTVTATVPVAVRRPPYASARTRARPPGGSRRGARPGCRPPGWRGPAGRRRPGRGRRARRPARDRQARARRRMSAATGSAPAQRGQVRGRGVRALAAGQEGDSRDLFGNDAAERAHRLRRDLLRQGDVSRAARAGPCSASAPPRPWRPRNPQFREHAEQPGRRDGRAALRRVPAVHQDFWLHDRDQASLVAQRRVASQGVRVGAQPAPRRDSVADREHRAPLGEPGPEPGVLRQPLAQAVQALGDLLPRRPGQRPGTQVHLDARQQPAARQRRGEGLARRRAAAGRSRRRG